MTLDASRTPKESLADPFAGARQSNEPVARSGEHPVVHLELSTGNLARACAFLTTAFGWKAQAVQVGPGSYVALDWGEGTGGGVVEREGNRSLWVPYIEVADIATMTERAMAAGATITLEPREGPAGWRSALTAPDGAPLALWQPKL